MAQKIIDTTTPQPNGKIGDTAKVAFEKINGNFEELYDAVANIPEDVTGDIEALDTRVTANEGAISALRGYIDGLRMEWVSGTSLRVTGGAAYVPGLHGILGVESPITKSGLSLSANTWYHLYLYRNGGSADIEISTTEPAEPYSGAARTKSGDTNRRYIGSIRTGASGEVLGFYHRGDSILWHQPSGSPYRILSAGKATTPTPISISGICPATASMVFFKGNNFANSAGDSSVLNVGSASDKFQFALHPDPIAENAYGAIPIDVGSTNIYYYFSSAPSSNSNSGAYLDVTGYGYAR